MNAVDRHPHALWPAMVPYTAQGRSDLCLKAAYGTRVRFADGRELLCGTSGLWNVNLGYGNEAIAEATARALRDASYLGSWGYENVYSRAAAEAIVQIVGLGDSARVLFSTSGVAANDLAMKVARHYQVLKGAPDRRLIVGLRDGFHGMTFGAFALTDGRLGQEMYGVDRRLVGHLPANDVEALKQGDDRTRKPDRRRGGGTGHRQRRRAARPGLCVRAVRPTRPGGMPVDRRRDLDWLRADRAERVCDPELGARAGHSDHRESVD